MCALKRVTSNLQYNDWRVNCSSIFLPTAVPRRDQLHNVVLHSLFYFSDFTGESFAFICIHTHTCVQVNLIWTSVM